MLRPPKPFFLLARLSHSLTPCLGSVKPEQVQRRDDVDPFAGGGTERGWWAEVSHPWPEWAALMDRLVKRGYLDRSSAPGNASKDSNHIRTACLNFAREHSDLIRQFSKREIQIVVGSGCPSLDRKVVNSAKRLRSHVGIDERQVCSSCNLRGSCDRAYTKARENEGGRTVDIVRILLTYGLDVVTGTINDQASVTKAIRESVRKLLTEVVDFTIKELNSNTPEPDPESSRGHQMQKSRNTVPMKQGDWICPKCFPN